MIIRRLILCLSIFSFFVSGCKTDDPWEKEDIAIQNYLEANGITEPPKASGLYYIETQAGTGAQAVAGKKAKVKYTGTFLNGRQFDANTLTFTVGAGKVIAGWDEGISYMKVGGKALLIIPSDLAYGPYGYGSIPGYTPLLFTVELLAVN
jgi:FKBP-type peptidyl-prolyl cis-trans isomerase